MVSAPSTEQVIDLTRTAQLIALVKENQLTTALVCFLLWQLGILASAQSYASGVVC